MEQKQYVLETRDLVVHYDTEDGNVEAVNGINLKLEPRHTIGLVGETGAGKTTTALALLRLVPDPPGVIRSGEILINGENILEKSVKEMEGIRGKEIAMVFQDPMTALDPVFTVGEQIAESVLQHEKLTQAQANGALRLTIGTDTTQEEIDQVLQILPPIVEDLRRMVSQ